MTLWICSLHLWHFLHRLLLDVRSDVNNNVIKHMIYDFNAIVFGLWEYFYLLPSLPFRAVGGWFFFVIVPFLFAWTCCPSLDFVLMNHYYQSFSWTAFFKWSSFLSSQWFVTVFYSIGNFFLLDFLPFFSFRKTHSANLIQQKCSWT